MSDLHLQISVMRNLEEDSTEEPAALAFVYEAIPEPASALEVINKLRVMALQAQEQYADAVRDKKQ